jgi:hypothetical protein
MAIEVFIIISVDKFVNVISATYMLRQSWLLRQGARLLKLQSRLRKKNTRVIDILGIVMTSIDEYHIKQQEL